MTTALNRDQQQAIIRGKVQQLLGGSRAYQLMPAAERARIFADTAAVVEGLARNGGEGVLAQRLPKPPSDRRAPEDPWARPLDVSPGPGAPLAPGRAPPSKSSSTRSTGDFGAGLEKGVQQAGQILREVNFPDFVSALIKGVFQAIVDSSIQQMKAYGELVQSVAMSMNDFRDQNVSDNQARDHLVSKYPSLLQIKVTDGKPRVSPRDGADSQELPDFKKDLGLDEDIGSLDEETIEAKMVPAARDQVALGRQKLLATMVLMGINRIIVTDGKINAKLKFNFTATDSMRGTDSATKYDNLGTNLESGATSTEGVDSNGVASIVKDRRSSSRPIIQVSDQSDTTTKADLNATAQLTGEVSVNFRSETFPLEKMVNTDQMTQLQSAGAGRAAPAPSAPNAPAASAPAAPMPPPAPAPAPAAAPAR